MIRKMAYDNLAHFSHNWSRGAFENYTAMLAQVDDERVRQALIGAKIIDVKIAPIENRKRMFLLEIKTSAQPITSVMDSRVKICVNTLKLKVKF